MHVHSCRVTLYVLLDDMHHAPVQDGVCHSVLENRLTTYVQSVILTSHVPVMLLGHHAAIEVTLSTASLHAQEHDCMAFMKGDETSLHVQPCCHRLCHTKSIRIDPFSVRACTNK